MLDNFVLPAVVSGWSTTASCVSFSCVAWQPFYSSVDWASRTNRMASAKVSQLRLLFVGLGQEGSLAIVTKNTWWTRTTESRYFCRCSFRLLRRDIESVCEVCRSVWKNAVRMLKCDTKLRCMGFKLMQDLYQYSISFKIRGHLMFFFYLERIYRLEEILSRREDSVHWMGEDTGETGQWIYRNQAKEKDQVDGVLKGCWSMH